MPVLEKDDTITTRSALRHRPIHTTSNSGKRSSSIVTNATTPVVQRASRPRPHVADTDIDSQDDIVEWQRIELEDEGGESEPDEQEEIYTPVRRASAKASSRSLPETPNTPRPKSVVRSRTSKRHLHPLLYLGLGMLAMLALWIGLMSAINWFNTTIDDIHYGRPRTCQIDARVGHNDDAIPSHFIALNFHGRIEVIEMPGGDATHARVYLGPQLYSSDADLVPVTLKFADLNGDNQPDMIVSFQGSRVVFINDHGGFRPLRPEERPQVEQALQRLGL